MNESTKKKPVERVSKDFIEMVSTQFLGFAPNCATPDAEDIINGFVDKDIDITISHGFNGVYKILLNGKELDEQFDDLFEALCFAAMYALLNEHEITQRSETP